MGLDGYYRSYSFNSSNGTFRLSNYIGDDWEEIKQQYKNEDVYFSVTGYVLWEHGEFSREEVYDSPVCHRYSISSRVRDYELDIVQKTTYTKGSTSYGDVASSGSGTYPTNNYSGNYWYVYKGSDTIDPTAVSYDASTVIAGETVSVTISPSSGNSYGGTITYSVEVNVDETGWEPYTETTSTSFTFTIPEDAVSWRCRVKARDNLGFT